MLAFTAAEIMPGRSFALDGEPANLEKEPVPKPLPRPPPSSFTVADAVPEEVRADVTLDAGVTADA
jgi:hypothetical protein